ncbi:hypothetical protein [Burkholderia sp. Ac-20379]|uniref:hypothetical protein n=1 Tax=Burkholderia sp. Ac-20379 TaxID=2703900 RepID=UPI00197FDB37|nr:hypothetical protein [Burkholderia sp. Ac-20379]MBN3723060.1 hypothetical protein [Burkholderia sp. Ac-20379]
MLSIVTGCATGISQPTVQMDALLKSPWNVNSKDWIPTEPMIYDLSELGFSGLNSEQMLTKLAVGQWTTTIGKIDEKGSISYLVATGGLERGMYKISYEFLRYIVVPVTNPNTKKDYALARIGIGVRVDAVVNTTKAGLDLGSLFKLGIAASTQKAQGAITVQTIGISSPGINSANFSSQTIDENSIERIYESIGLINAKLDDAKTVLTPMEVAVKYYPKEPNSPQ